MQSFGIWGLMTRRSWLYCTV